jgi:hypothetical protein
MNSSRYHRKKIALNRKTPFLRGAAAFVLFLVAVVVFWWAIGWIMK